MLTEIPFFIIMVVIGLFTSLEDIRTGKIRNFWILIGIFYSFILCIFTGHAERLLFYHILTNIVLSFIAAYALWKYNYWFAGDAKLFSLYSILLPMAIYKKAYFPFFPSFQIFLYTFIFAAFYLLILSLIDFFKNPKENILKLLHFKGGASFLLKRTLGFTSIFLLNRILLDKVQLHFLTNDLETRILFLVLFFIYRPLNVFFEKHEKWHYLFIGAVLLAFMPLFLHDPIVAAKQFFSSLLICIILFIISDLYRKIVEDHIAHTSSKTMPFAPWLFLGVLAVWFFSIVR